MRNISQRLRDELLVLRCQQGSAEALDELVRSWHPRLLRYAQFQVNSPETAADLVQDAWVSVVLGMDRLLDPAVFPAWAYRIVTNRCRDWLRRQRTERRVYESLQHCEVGRPAAAKPESDALERALLRLDVDDRTLVRLRYFEELTVSQVADVLGVPGGTVKSRLHRCRETLRKHLEETNRE